LGISAAGVPGRIEYWNVKADAESRQPHDSKGLLEVFFGLAGEADDDVGRDGGVRNLCAHAIEDAEELLRAVRPASSP
jgi:hypothetical protein